MLTVDQGTMVFDEGPISGRTFTSPGYAQPETQQLYTLIWSHVPEEYVCNSQGDLVRLDAALQCVNSTTFLGRRPGTLLMEPYKVERRRIPLSYTDGFPRYWLRIEINLKYFDPVALYGSLPQTTVQTGTFTDEKGNKIPLYQPVTGTITEGSKDITNVSPMDSAVQAAAQPGVEVTAYGIVQGSKIVAVTGTTITLDRRAIASKTGANLSIGRTKFGHLTAPAGLMGYYHFKTSANAPGSPGRDRLEGYDFNKFFYPLTLAERQ